MALSNYSNSKSLGAVYSVSVDLIKKVDHRRHTDTAEVSEDGLTFAINSLLSSEIVPPMLE